MECRTFIHPCLLHACMTGKAAALHQDHRHPAHGPRNIPPYRGQVQTLTPSLITFRLFPLIFTVYHVSFPAITPPLSNQPSTMFSIPPLYLISVLAFALGVIASQPSLPDLEVRDQGAWTNAYCIPSSQDLSAAIVATCPSWAPIACTAISEPG
jgi:hypothetical protein